MVRFARGAFVVAAADVIDRRYVVRHVLVQLRRAILDRTVLIDDRGQCFVVDIDQTDGVVGHGLGSRHDQRHAFADKAHAVNSNDGPIRDFGAGQNPVRHDRADLSDEVGARQGQANARRRTGRGEIDATDDGVSVR